MSECIKIKNGLNIQLTGEANKLLSDLPLPEVFTIKPSEFTGISPKVLVKPGDEVLAGSPLFFDKNNESIIFCSPVSGEIIEVVRAEKRKLLEIKILADKEIKYLDLGKSNPDELSRDGIIEALLKGGLWPLIRQRPFGIIANHTEIPKSIFISAFDTNPLAPDIDFIMQGENQETFQTGLNAIIKLTNGNTHLNINGAKETASIFRNSRGVIINKFSGPHPAGNIGVQINHIDPINKGEVVWYLNPQDVLVIGKLFSEGRYDASRIIALTGSQVSSPKYYKTVIGTSVKSILNDGGLKAGENRIISGNVLSGSQIQEDGFLGYYDTQITVIPEGHESEFMGWLAPGLEKFSMSRTFFSWLNSKKKYNLNTNLHGEERPFVVTGQYEKVFPMDIYPVQLLKSILIEDIEMMEQLGIYEVVEEDFALCEFVCTSKIKSQEIIKRGIEIIQKELN